MNRSRIAQEVVALFMSWKLRSRAQDIRMLTVEDDGKGNYVSGGNIILRMYKTAPTYGVKDFRIEDRRFVHVVDTLGAAIRSRFPDLRPGVAGYLFIRTGRVKGPDRGESISLLSESAFQQLLHSALDKRDITLTDIRKARATSEGNPDEYIRLSRMASEMNHSLATSVTHYQHRAPGTKRKEPPSEAPAE